MPPEAIQEMGQYAPGFKSEVIKMAGQEAIRVEGVFKNSPETKVLDFYILHDLNLYSLLFSVDPQSSWEVYEPLIMKIVNSFEFVPPDPNTENPADSFPAQDRMIPKESKS